MNTAKPSFFPSLKEGSAAGYFFPGSLSKPSPSLFYSVEYQMILPVKGEPLGGKGLKWSIPTQHNLHNTLGSSHSKQY